MSNAGANLQVRVRTETRQVIDRIAESRGWTLSETMHRLASAFVERNPLPDGAPVGSTNGAREADRSDSIRSPQPDSSAAASASGSTDKPQRRATDAPPSASDA